MFGTRVSSVAIVSLFGVAPVLAAGQSKPVTLQVDLKVGGAAYAVTGNGECHATDDASIFNVPAALKSARHSDATRNLTFTFWRLAKGGDMITLDVSVGGKRHRVNTLTVAPAPDRRGSGAATFRARGSGGVFSVDATADTGARVTGQITCSAFAKPEENG